MNNSCQAFPVTGDALAESPSESAPAPEGGDERARFETWARKLNFNTERAEIGYTFRRTQAAWEAWEERAKLLAPEGMGRDAKDPRYYDKFGKLNWTSAVNVAHLILQLQTLDPEMKVSSVIFIDTKEGRKARAYGTSMSRERWNDLGWLDYKLPVPECLAIWASLPEKVEGVALAHPTSESRTVIEMCANAVMNMDCSMQSFNRGNVVAFIRSLTAESGDERIKNLANKCTCVERKYSSLIPECTLSDEEHEILEKAAHGISALPRSGVEEAVKELYKVHYSRELKLPLEDWIVERDSAIIHRHLASYSQPSVKGKG